MLEEGCVSWVMLCPLELGGSSCEVRLIQACWLACERATTCWLACEAQAHSHSAHQEGRRVKAASQACLSTHACRLSPPWLPSQLCAELDRRLRQVYNREGQELVLHPHILSARALWEQEGQGR